MTILELNNICKTFNGHAAADGVSFAVKEGGIFGLLGPNGAGKTTLIRIITRILAADSGSVLFLGREMDARDAGKIGYMPEERGLYRRMRTAEHIRYIARLRGMGRKEAQTETAQWLEKFGLQEWENRKIDELSKGMQQKVQFIMTVMHRPALLILDEPFSGLDPINANLLKEEILRLRAGGATVIFSTHRMEQVEELCEEIVLINKGKNILAGEVAAIRQRYRRHEYHIGFYGKAPVPQENLFSVRKTSENACILQLQDTALKTSALLQTLIAQGVEVTSFREVLPSLEEIFIREVGQAPAETAVP